MKPKEPEKQKERQRGKKDYRVGLKIVASRYKTKQHREKQQQSTDEN